MLTCRFVTRSLFHTRLFVSMYECQCTYVCIYVRTYTRQARQPGLLVDLKFEDNNATVVARIRQSRGKVSFQRSKQTIFSLLFFARKDNCSCYNES